MPIAVVDTHTQKPKRMIDRPVSAKQQPGGISNGNCGKTIANTET